MKRIYLECTSEGHSKFYRMIERPDGMFDAEYGRIGYTPKVITYPMSKWYTIYTSKMHKGYQEAQDLFPREDHFVDSMKLPQINNELAMLFGV